MDNSLIHNIVILNDSNPTQLTPLNKNNITRIAFGIVLLSLLFAILVGAGFVSILKVLFPKFYSIAISLLSMFVSTLMIALPVIVYLRINGLSIRRRLRINRISKNTLFSIIIIFIKNSPNIFNNCGPQRRFSFN